MSDLLKETLLALEKKNNLAHFYLVSSSSMSKNASLFDWTCQLVENFIAPSSLVSCADVLILEAAHDAKQYPIETLEQVFNFLKHKATQVKRKYLIINHAHKLTKIHLNKLLKTLEEPPIEVCIFIINNNNTAIMQTVNSRAIHLRVHSKSSKLKDTTKLKDFIINQSNGLQELVKFIGENDLNDSQLMDALIDVAYELDIPVQTFNSIKESLLGLDEDIVFNSSHLSKSHKIYQCISSLRQCL